MNLLATLLTAAALAAPPAPAPSTAPSSAPSTATVALPSGARVQVPGAAADWTPEVLPDGSRQWETLTRAAPGAPALQVALQVRRGPTLCWLALAPAARFVAGAELGPRPWLPPGWHPDAVQVPLQSGARAFACADLPDGVLVAVVTTGGPDLAAAALEAQPILSSYARHVLWQGAAPPDGPRPQALPASRLTATLPADWRFEARSGLDVLQRMRLGVPALAVGLTRDSFDCAFWENGRRVDPKPYARLIPRPAWVGAAWAAVAVEIPEPRGHTLELCLDVGGEHVVASLQYGGRIDDPDLAEAAPILSSLAAPAPPLPGKPGAAGRPRR